MVIDATNYEPVDFIWRDFYRWRVNIYAVTPTSLNPEPTVINLKCVIDRPLGTLRFGDLIVTPNYDFRIFLAYKYVHPATGATLILTPDLIAEGYHVEFERDGRRVHGVVLRRYAPADAGAYLTLEVREQAPTGTIEPLNP